MALPLRVVSNLADQAADSAIDAAKGTLVSPLTATIKQALGPFAGINDSVKKAITEAKKTEAEQSELAKKTASAAGDNTKEIKKSNSLLGNMNNQLTVLSSGILGLKESLEAQDLSQTLDPKVFEGQKQSTDNVVVEVAKQTTVNEDSEDELKKSNNFLSKLVETGKTAAKLAVTAAIAAAVPAIVAKDRSDFKKQAKEDEEKARRIGLIPPKAVTPAADPMGPLQRPKTVETSVTYKGQELKQIKDSEGNIIRQDSVVDAERKDLQGPTPLREMGMQKRQPGESGKEYRARLERASQNRPLIRDDLGERAAAFGTPIGPADSEAGVQRVETSAAQPSMENTVQQVEPSDTSSLPSGISRDSATGLYKAFAYNSEKDGVYPQLFETAEEAVKYRDEGRIAANKKLTSQDGAELPVFMEKDLNQARLYEPPSPVPSEGPKPTATTMADNALQPAATSQPTVIVQNNTNNNSQQSSPTIVAGGAAKAEVPLN